MSVVPKHIFICAKKKPEGIPDCHEKGGFDLFNAFAAAVYKAGKEKDILVSSSGCMGVCNHGPTVVVYPEGKWYTGVKLEEVDTILEKHLIGGETVERESLDEATIQGEQQSWHMKNRMRMKQEGLL